jgi:hypothetical protein
VTIEDTPTRREKWAKRTADLVDEARKTGKEKWQRCRTDENALFTPDMQGLACGAKGRAFEEHVLHTSQP